MPHIAPPLAGNQYAAICRCLLSFAQHHGMAQRHFDLLNASNGPDGDRAIYNAMMLRENALCEDRWELLSSSEINVPPLDDLTLANSIYSRVAHDLMSSALLNNQMSRHATLLSLSGTNAGQKLIFETLIYRETFSIGDQWVPVEFEEVSLS
ncbi:hypothetical protein K0504_09950 [Neiella marina]|uniref:Uncharacterized protein n=1 Tax=Neiella holothuriorum TaxID=2870530 RepID=A0ABS7EGP0_9GAMM|nr:hypothetical protein [Neiella holothuriorum]MBW8191360.1 hypothetical protein [Neiella holothuriorum]